MRTASRGRSVRETRCPVLSLKLTLRTLEEGISGKAKDPTLREPNLFPSPPLPAPRSPSLPAEGSSIYTCLCLAGGSLRLFLEAREAWRGRPSSWRGRSGTVWRWPFLDTSISDVNYGFASMGFSKGSRSPARRSPDARSNMSPQSVRLCLCSCLCPSARLKVPGKCKLLAASSSPSFFFLLW